LSAFLSSLGTLRSPSAKLRMLFCVLKGMPGKTLSTAEVADLPQNQALIVTDCLPNQNKAVYSQLTFR
jgi:hypothetical protein